MAVALADLELIERRLTILKLPSLSEHAEYELNYLHELASALRATQRIKISRFLLALLYCAVGLGTARAEVLAQYDESFALFNRTRRRFEPPEIRARRRQQTPS